ncbi:hypothetical protein GCM10027280_18440 [Micromonospora polyrhachis]|uniref:Uncharacterized protein n=1 Tax=Micromonospora polyrhachis TaxID=1282883 RepID=A0A7W7SLE5_9ACTN|nr:hypothetical protein [Micromonospora polyrhachis]MBB4956939.1 hypothetical protein [Micromonospora polyrhachis]
MTVEPQSRPRNGFAGGAILVLTMTIVLVVVLLVVMGQGTSPPPVEAGRAAPGQTPAVDTGAEPPTIPPDWLTLTPGVEVTQAPEATLPPDEPATPGHTGAPTPRTTASRSYGFTAVAGAGCAETATAGSVARYPASSPLVVMAGGWTGPGCSRSLFWSVPMSGAGDRSDTDIQVLWWFSTGTSATGSCEVWVYVPKAQREVDAAGKPTAYQVLRGRADATVVGTFTIDQTANRGSWVRAGSYRLERGQIAVRLLNQGTGAPGARHAAAQVQVGCAR